PATAGAAPGARRRNRHQVTPRRASGRGAGPVVRAPVGRLRRAPAQPSGGVSRPLRPSPTLAVHEITMRARRPSRRERRHREYASAISENRVNGCALLHPAILRLFRRPPRSALLQSHQALGPARTGALILLLNFHMPPSNARRHRVAVVLGTRPEALKMAPVIHALGRQPDLSEPVVITTSQQREM